MVIVYIGTGYTQVLYLGRAPRTKETLPDFHEWRRVTRHPLVFRGLTGSQRTPENWGVTHVAHCEPLKMCQLSRITLVASKNVQILTVSEFDEIRRGR